MSGYRQHNPRELEERIVFLQLTLATLKAQLDNQHSRDADAAPATDEQATIQQPSFVETPLAIAAG